jgi:hypothetical protein
MLIKRTNSGKHMLLAVAVAVVMAWPAWAHHGVANLYDVSKAVQMKGTITKFEWTNPHNQIFFDVTDASGTVKHWVVATEPPQVMLERDWTRRSLKPGDEVTLYVFVATNGAPVGNLQRLVLANGKELSAAPLPQRAPGN